MVTRVPTVTINLVAFAAAISMLSFPAQKATTSLPNLHIVEELTLQTTKDARSSKISKIEKIHPTRKINNSIVLKKM